MTQTPNKSSAFTAHYRRINITFQAIDERNQRLYSSLLAMRDNRLYLEKYASFKEYCDIELKEWGGYEKVQSIFTAFEGIDTQQGGVSC